MIQAKWKKGRLTDFISLKRGFDITKKESVTGSVWVYSSSGRSYRNSVARVRGPGVITGRKGILGKVFYSEEDFWPHDTTLWVDDFKGNNPKYVCWFLRSLHLERFDAASSVPTLNRNSVLPIQVKFPPLQQQESISKLLDTWDEALEKLDALIQAKEQRKKALMQQLLTGKKRLKGFEGEWKLRKASDVFENYSERNKIGAPVLSVTQDLGVVLRSNLDRKINHDAEKADTYKVVRPGCFVISLRSFQGGLEYSNLRGAVSPAYHVIRPKIKISPAFYRHYFKSVDFIGRLAISVIGIRDGKQISYPDFSFMQIPFPPIEAQERIGNILDTCDSELGLLRKQRDAINHQKRGLMQRLLTGRIRVIKDNEKTSEPD